LRLSVVLGMLSLATLPFIGVFARLMWIGLASIAMILGPSRRPPMRHAG